MTYFATPRRRTPWLGATLASALAFSALATASVSAAPKPRFQIDQKGDVILIGNTMGHDCRPGVPQPVVGDVGSCGTEMSKADSSPDIYWRSDSPVDGKAEAQELISPEQSRTTAVLKLPQGAQVTYARIYWGANLAEDKPDKTAIATAGVTIDRPGTSGFSVKARSSNPENDVQFALAGGYLFQASADVTALLQRYGSGAYRVSGVARRGLVNRDVDVEYAAWSMVVFYRNDSEPVRNLALFDGLDAVALGSTVDLSIRGFNVPPGSSAEGKLGVIAYEGDSDKNDTLTFNGQPLIDPQNPAGNFFNGSRSLLGQAVSNVGDLPQLTGGPASMSGLDLDLVDVGTRLNPGDTSASLQVTSTDDIIYVGALVTSVRSKKPVLETTLVADPPSVRPNTSIQFTSTTKNVGDDEAGNIVIRHPLPDGLTYEPGSLQFVSGPENSQNGNKTDQSGDDQAEVVDNPNTGRKELVIRIGKGANRTSGGTLSPTDTPVVVKYRLKTGPNAMGDIPTQSETTGTPTSKPDLGTTSFPSGNGTNPGSPTVVRVPTATADLRVNVTKTPESPTPGTPVKYTVDLTNVGNTTDPGPLRVTVKLPPNTPESSVTVTPKDGWSCTKGNGAVTCTRDGGLTPGTNTPVAEITIPAPPTGQPDGGVTITGTSEGAIDPNPADNTWDERGGGSLRVAGGGFSCSVDRSMGLGASAAGVWGISSAALLLWTLARRRRRSDAQA